mmetsp:Transcript_69449/g.140696  ORF Transcript_69449/g.140696 Transcript_69449/m.140696 type:complete len:207 (-) Transcript_69449:2265-2885(-)
MTLLTKKSPSTMITVMACSAPQRTISALLAAGIGLSTVPISNLPQTFKECALSVVFRARSNSSLPWMSTQCNFGVTMSSSTLSVGGNTTLSIATGNFPSGQLAASDQRLCGRYPSTPTCGCGQPLLGHSRGVKVCLNWPPVGVPGPAVYGLPSPPATFTARDVVKRPFTIGISGCSSISALSSSPVSLTYPPHFSWADSVRLKASH